jgi:tetratricopeptide (TPR) repeat protein
VVFTGRGEALATLDESIAHPGSPFPPVVICGPAGVGKTTLAVHWAHRIADQFPDGQLYLNLRGFSPGTPMRPVEALGRLLAGLDVPAKQIPTELDTATAMYRTRLADRRMLVVLDNARDAEQVRPLLPATPGCLALITSRDRLTGLIARDDARRLTLDVFTSAEATTLIRQLIPNEPQSEARANLIRACGYLPLAIRIAAAHLADRPSLPVADYVAAMRSGSGLDALEVGGDPDASVRSAFTYSYRALDPGTQRLFRLLGLIPGPDVTPAAAAALADTDPGQAQRLLDNLARAHLVQPGRPTRYALHDLLRAYAGELAMTGDDVERTNVAALDRLLDYYRHVAWLAMDAAHPYEREDSPRVPPARRPTPELSDPATALSWLDIELPNLLAAATYATEHDRPAHILHLSTILHRHLRNRGLYHDAETLHHQALATARATGDQAAELEALTGLGHIHRRRGRHAQATEHYQRALQLARATGHRVGELKALTGLAWIHRAQGRYAPAADHLKQALQLARTTGHRIGELNALTGLGDLHVRHGRYAQAIEHYEETLLIARATGNRTVELNALRGLGEVHAQQGRYAQASDHYRQTLQIARATGNRTVELNALTGLAQLYRRQGRNAQASDHYQQLLEFAQQTGERNFEFEAWQGLGRLQLATGHAGAAIADHDRALAIAGQLGQLADQARAHDGLAHAHQTLNQPELARRHWQHAIDILNHLEVDRTEDEETTAAAIRTHLARHTSRKRTHTRSAYGGPARRLRGCRPWDLVSDPEA